MPGSAISVFTTPLIQFRAHRSLQGSHIGGGVALLRASVALRPQVTENELENQAKHAVASVLEEPIRQLVENAKRSPTQILAQILNSNSPCVGLNAEGCKVEDLVLAGVLDPIGPIDLSLRVAMSHAGSVLQTGAWDIRTRLINA